MKCLLFHIGQKKVAFVSRQQLIEYFEKEDYLINNVQKNIRLYNSNKKYKEDREYEYLMDNINST